MPYFDQVQRCSFGGIDIVVDRIEIRGGIRHHVHEYPHQGGGKPEKLGRKLYQFRVSAVFDENIFSYTDNYPDSLFRLRHLITSQATDKLVLPNIGTTYAYCHDFSHTWTWQIRSGERAEFEFTEDPQDFPLPGFEEPTVQAMFINLDTFEQEAQRQQDRLAARNVVASESAPLDIALASRVDPSLLSSISNAFNSLLIAKDQADLAGILLEQKIDAVTNYVNALDAAITSPLDYQLLQAAKQLAKSAADLGSARNARSPIKFWTTPRTMNVSAISTSLYGDTSHAMDILDLNPIDNAYAVPVNTTIRYYDTTNGISLFGSGTGGPPPKIIKAA